MKRRKIELRLLVVFILLLISLALFIYSSKRSVTPESSLNITQKTTTTTTRPFQENISIKIPEGVVGIGKRGRIEIVG